MDHGFPKQKSERDRIRQQRGVKRKEQVREIRKVIAAWRDGREAEECMHAIAGILDERAPR